MFWPYMVLCCYLIPNLFWSNFSRSGNDLKVFLDFHDHECSYVMLFIYFIFNNTFNMMQMM